MTKSTIFRVAVTGVILAALATPVLTDAGIKIGQGNDRAVNETIVNTDSKSQVDTLDGKPQAGRNPSSQRQTSLAEAGSSRSGPGLQTDTPAAGVGTTQRADTKPSDVHDNHGQTKSNPAGCITGYGKPGEQCLPASIASDGTVTCAEVRKTFPKGVQITGHDHYALDKNRDGIACNSGD